MSPIHLCSTESLADLNTRLEKKISVYNFRPNIILGNVGQPYSEVEFFPTVANTLFRLLVVLLGLLERSTYRSCQTQMDRAMFTMLITNCWSTDRHQRSQSWAVENLANVSVLCHTISFEGDEIFFVAIESKLTCTVSKRCLASIWDNSMIVKSPPELFKLVIQWACSRKTRHFGNKTKKIRNGDLQWRISQWSNKNRYT